MTTEKSSKIWIVSIFSVILIGALIRVVNFGTVGYRAPDERTYAALAKVDQLQGSVGIQKIANADLKDNSLFRHAAIPTRIGYIWLVSKTMSITGFQDERAAALLSLLSSLLSLMMIALIGWRYFKPITAVIATLFYAVSPIDLFLSRRGYQDSIVILIAFLSLYLAYKITSVPKAILWPVLFGILGGFTVTIKESPFMGFLVCLLWVLWFLVRRKELKTSIIMVGAFIAGLTTALSLMSSYLGGFQTLTDLVFTVPKYYATNVYSLEFESGSPFLFFQALWVLSPAALLLIIPGFFATFSSSEIEEKKHISERPSLLLALLLLLFVGLAVGVSHKLNPRYITFAIGPWCLMSGYGASFLFSQFIAFLRSYERHVVAYSCALMILLAALLDYGTFETKIVRGELQDLSVRMVVSPYVYQEPKERPNDEVLFAKTVALNQPTPEHFNQLAFSSYSAGHYDDCIAASQEAIRLNPNSAEAFNNEAACYLKLGKWDSSISASNQALRIEPTMMIAQNNLAAATARKDASQVNITNLEKAISDLPSAEKYLDLSAAYYQAAQYEKCIATAREALNLKPDFAPAYNNICAANIHLGNFAEGKKAAEQALRIDPNNQLAKNNLEWSERELNKK